MPRSRALACAALVIAAVHIAAARPSQPRSLVVSVTIDPCFNGPGSSTAGVPVFRSLQEWNFEEQSWGSTTSQSHSLGWVRVPPLSTPAMVAWASRAVVALLAGVQGVSLVTPAPTVAAVSAAVRESEAGPRFYVGSLMGKTRNNVNKMIQKLTYVEQQYDLAELARQAPGALLLDLDITRGRLATFTGQMYGTTPKYLACVVVGRLMDPGSGKVLKAAKCEYSGRGLAGYTRNSTGGWDLRHDDELDLKASDMGGASLVELREGALSAELGRVIAGGCRETMVRLGLLKPLAKGEASPALAAAGVPSFLAPTPDATASPGSITIVVPLGPGGTDAPPVPPQP
jgi:hypothetical protein